MSEKEIEKMLEDLEKKNPVLKMFGILGRAISYVIKDVASLDKRIEKLEKAKKSG